MTSCDHRTQIPSLAELSEEATKLKDYRKDAETYLEKCDNIVARLTQVFEITEVQDLSPTDIDHLRHIKDCIQSEEHFAKAAHNVRDPENWLGDLKESE